MTKAPTLGCLKPRCWSLPGFLSSVEPTMAPAPTGGGAGGSERVEPLFTSRRSLQLWAPWLPSPPSSLLSDTACRGVGRAHRNDGGPQRAKRPDLHQGPGERQGCAETRRSPLMDRTSQTEPSRSFSFAFGTARPCPHYRRVNLAQI